MKKNLAVLLSALLLLSASACGKTTTVSTPDSAPAAESMETNAIENKNAASSAEVQTDADDEPSETTATTEGESESASAANGETTADSTQPATPNLPLTADDDEMGELESGGGGNGGTTQADAPADNAAATSADTPGSSTNDKLHITIETAEVTIDELKAQDYVVPLVITLDKNPGITYSEWGLKLDERCTYDYSQKGMDFSTTAYINDKVHFLWTAWTSGEEPVSDDGSLLTLLVTVPRDATPGTTYPICYADWSKNNAPHVWTGGSNDWVAQKAVGWTDGGVVIK